MIRVFCVDSRLLFVFPRSIYFSASPLSFVETGTQSGVRMFAFAADFR